MSLSNQPPAPLAEYSQLCKTPNPDGFSDPFACMGTPKEFGAAAFEWQRTEGKLSEIGLHVHPPRPDGLGKSSGFTDEDKLCFFEGKLEKDLKAASKDQRETEAPSKPYQPASGHLEKWAPGSEKSHFGESPGILGSAGLQTEPAGCLRGSPVLEPNRGITDREKAAGSKSGEVDAKGRPETPKDLSNHLMETEIRAWAPTFDSVLSEAAGPKNGALVHSPVDLLKDSSLLSGFGSASKLGPPTTMIELAQDDGKGSSSFGTVPETEEERFLAELEEKLDSAPESSFLSRGGTQRKAMRRAMSECSHLSVPPAFNLVDKYPELVTLPDRESPPSILSQSVTPRKPSAPMKRSATVSEEQASAHRPGQDNAAPLCPILKEPLLPTEEEEEEEEKKRDRQMDGSGSDAAVKRELGSPGSFHPKLALIPETSDRKKGEEVAAVKGGCAQLSEAVPSVEAGRSSPGLAKQAFPGILGTPSSWPGERPYD
ncbi:uncharacterized protein LOC113430761, partial [Notechis scutatus]|uniref:Uncharacterized protein LOC113430761 n=1 Tax=Notechis scutatus TaxID=8663 RepID=A0A6J1W1A1_9SAUR